MCIIMIAPKGSDKNSEFLFDSIRTGLKNNIDGSGYACNIGGLTYFKKGFNDVELLIEDIKSKELTNDTSLIIHHRFGNCGEKGIENCHPFIMSDVDELLDKNDSLTNIPVLFHNGTFYKYREYTSDKSDTYYFVKKFMSIPEVHSVFKRDINLFATLFEDHVRHKTSNKIAVLYPDGEIITYGDFNEEQGYMFSNEQWKPFTVFNSQTKQICEVNPNIETVGSHGGTTKRIGFQTRIPKDPSNLEETRSTISRQSIRHSDISRHNNMGVAYGYSSNNRNLSISILTENTFKYIVFRMNKTFMGLHEGKEYRLLKYDTEFRVWDVCELSTPHTTYFVPTIKFLEYTTMKPMFGFEHIIKDYQILKNNFTSKKSLKYINKRMNEILRKEKTPDSINVRKLGSINVKAFSMFYKDNLDDINDHIYKPTTPNLTVVN